jgi:hypothetical protein
MGSPNADPAGRDRGVRRQTRCSGKDDGASKSGKRTGSQQAARDPRHYGIEAAMAEVAGIAVSLALQFGCPAETLCKMLSNGQGSAAGLLSILLDLLRSENFLP